jgi:predicted dehydrogenase
MRKIRWGVLGVAKIAVDKVIPAMQRGEHTSIVAIASRSLEKAKEAASRLGIERAYGSYEELVADPNVDAIYNPLPNHLHVPWTIRAAEAKKHVLCEKPIALSAAEAKTLLAVRDRTGVQIQEAFMVRTHPQWLLVRDLVRKGEIGKLRAIHGAFSYSNRDPKNVRNIASIGGGGVYDIGCYPITMSRFVFESEPLRVAALLERDPEMQIDRLASAILEFEQGHALFTVSTQLVAYQRMIYFGTSGRLQLEIPFNAPPDRPCRLLHDNGSDMFGTGTRVIDVPTCDQYTVQGDRFSKSILDGTPQPIPLEDAVANMAVLDAVFRAAERGTWERPAV